MSGFKANLLCVLRFLQHLASSTLYRSKKCLAARPINDFYGGFFKSNDFHSLRSLIDVDFRRKMTSHTAPGSRTWGQL